MKIKTCNNCRGETAHRREPVQHPMSDDATIETCTECGFGTVVIPHIDTLNVHVKTAPQDLAAGVGLRPAAGGGLQRTGRGVQPVPARRRVNADLRWLRLALRLLVPVAKGAARGMTGGVLLDRISSEKWRKRNSSPW